VAPDPEPAAARGAAVALELRLLPGRLAVCRLAPDQGVPAWLHRVPFWSATRTAEELSLVVPEGYASESWRCELGFRALVVAGPLAFAQVGILAELAGALAAAAVSLLALSTFDTDYLLVREPDLAAARAALAARGHRVWE
jgi:uncharacterized protein